jgi:hypothetical protein
VSPLTVGELDAIIAAEILRGDARAYDLRVRYWDSDSGDPSDYVTSVHAFGPNDAVAKYEAKIHSNVAEINSRRLVVPLSNLGVGPLRIERIRITLLSRAVALYGFLDCPREPEEEDTDT